MTSINGRPGNQWVQQFDTRDVKSDGTMTAGSDGKLDEIELNAMLQSVDNDGVAGFTPQQQAELRAFQTAYAGSMTPE